MTASTTEGQWTAVRLTDLDYDTDAIRLYLVGDDGPQEVASHGAAAAGTDVELTFRAPAPDTYHVVVKADVAGGDTRTLTQKTNALSVDADLSA